MMDSGMIGKIEKAKRYAEEKDRVALEVTAGAIPKPRGLRPYHGHGNDPGENAPAGQPASRLKPNLISITGSPNGGSHPFKR